MAATNKLKERLEAGSVCLNGWSMLPCGFTAENLTRAGWDSVTIDMQHGLHDYMSAARCIQAVEAHTTPLVRIPWNEPGIIGKVLDAGAWGVICPMVNTKQDAAALARACLYPPAGERSNGPVRAAALSGSKTYQSIANDEILVLPQIETAQAAENVGQILDVAGISGIYVGPSDLGFSMGLPPILDRDEPEILAIYDRLLQETRARGRIAGIHTASPKYAARMIELGFQFVTVGSDLAFVARGAHTAISAVRKAPTTIGSY